MHVQEIETAIRKLPIEKVIELSTWLEAYQAELGERQNETETEESRVNEEKWDELLSKPESKRVMRTMAHEALEEYRAGQTTGIAITEDGRLAPA